MWEVLVTCSSDYLHIPVIPGGRRVEMQIWLEGDLVLSPCLALCDEGGYYFFLDVKRFHGLSLTLIVPDSSGITEQCLDRILAGNAPEEEPDLYPDLYSEKYRPQFHFSSRRGWLNDPNGLVCKDGIYHMFYQHNPLGTPHGQVNVCWGHAISKDLLHWKELDDSIRPWVRKWSIASGSAVIDAENLAGYGNNAIIAAFTVLGTKNIDDTKPEYPSGGQYIAASTDDGKTFQRFSFEPTISTKDGMGWRDPRLFHYGDHYCLAVYETDEQRNNCVSFYVSKDFHTWRRTSRNQDLYECPDIFPLNVKGENTERWILYGADGKARIGDFDGYHFIESGISNPLDYGSATYAGQTWSNEPGGRRIHISWVRAMGGTGEDFGYDNMPFSQCMSFPAEITLQQTSNGLMVCRSPIPEYKKLISKESCVFNDWITTDHIVNMPNISICEAVLSKFTGDAEIRLGEHNIKYIFSKKELLFENGSTAPIDTEEISVLILYDITTIEIIFNNMFTATYSMYPEFRSVIFKGQCQLMYRVFNADKIWNDN